MMPTLTVLVHGGLECHAEHRGPLVLEVAPGSSLLDIQDRLGIPRGDVGLFVVDGELRSEGYVPPDGARVDLYPMFGGG